MLTDRSHNKNYELQDQLIKGQFKLFTSYLQGFIQSINTIQTLEELKNLKQKMLDLLQELQQHQNLMHQEDKNVYDMLRKEKIKNLSLKEDNSKLMEIAKKQKELFYLQEQEIQEVHKYYTNKIIYQWQNSLKKIESLNQKMSINFEVPYIQSNSTSDEDDLG